MRQKQSTLKKRSQSVVKKRMRGCPQRSLSEKWQKDWRKKMLLTVEVGDAGLKRLDGRYKSLNYNKTSPAVSAPLKTLCCANNAGEVVFLFKNHILGYY